MFFYYLKKIVVSPATYIAAGILSLTMLLGADTGSPVYPAYLFDYTFSIGDGGATFFLPVAAALPIAYLRHTLHKGAAWQLPLLRGTPLRDTLGGLAAAFVSGVLVFLLSAAAFHLYVVLVLPGPVSYDVSWYDAYYFYNQLPARVGYLIRIGVYAASAGMYALFAYGVSALTANQYICAASAFAFDITANTFLTIIAQGVPERYWYALAALNPITCYKYSIVSMTKDGGLIHLACYVLVIALLSGGLFWLRLKHRLKNG